MVPPSGQDSLPVREAYLRQRHQRRQFGNRGWMTFWIAIAIAAAWLFIAAFAGLGR